MEGAGEDVLLDRMFATARVRGFQGLDYNSVDVSKRTLRDAYLRPFKAAFDADALSRMASSNEISGMPSTGNHWQA